MGSCWLSGVDHGSTYFKAIQQDGIEMHRVELGEVVL